MLRELYPGWPADCEAGSGQLAARVDVTPPVEAEFTAQMLPDKANDVLYYHSCTQASESENDGAGLTYSSSHSHK
jgi:hypothetical protein